jgi:beta-glucosidase
VTNTGAVQGDEVVLAFTKPVATPELKVALLGAPLEIKKLFGFKRVTLAAGASTTLSFDLEPMHLALVDGEGHTSLHAVDVDVVFSRGHGEDLVARATVAPRDGEPKRLKELRKWW